MVDSFIANARVEEYIPLSLFRFTLASLTPLFHQPPRDSAHTPRLNVPKHCTSLHQGRVLAIVQPQHEPAPAPTNLVLL